MQTAVRGYQERDLPDMIRIWNSVVEAGSAFPQAEDLTAVSGAEFFAEQSYCAVAEDPDGCILGLYILHPNNVGRCGHICNASYAVDPSVRGLHIGRQLVSDCLVQAKKHGFRILQFNAVVATNRTALALYDKLGFVRIGTIPGGYRLADGSFVDIHICYHAAPDAAKPRAGGQK